MIAYCKKLNFTDFRVCAKHIAPSCAKLRVGLAFGRTPLAIQAWIVCKKIGLQVSCTCCANKYNQAESWNTVLATSFVTVLEFEFDHHAVSIPLLERLWNYFRKMNIPHPEQPHIAKLWIWARLLWCDPGQQRWPDPSNSRFFTTSPHLPTPVSWQRTFTARLPSSRCFYTENGTSTSTPAAPHLAAFPGPVGQSCFTAISCSILLQQRWG